MGRLTREIICLSMQGLLTEEMKLPNMSKIMPGEKNDCEIVVVFIHYVTRCRKYMSVFCDIYLFLSYFSAKWLFFY